MIYPIKKVKMLEFLTSCRRRIKHFSLFTLLVQMDSEKTQRSELQKKLDDKIKPMELSRKRKALQGSASYEQQCLERDIRTLKREYRINAEAKHLEIDALKKKLQATTEDARKKEEKLEEKLDKLEKQMAKDQQKIRELEKQLDAEKRNTENLKEGCINGKVRIMFTTKLGHIYRKKTFNIGDCVFHVSAKKQGMIEDGPDPDNDYIVRFDDGKLSSYVKASGLRDIFTDRHMYEGNVKDGCFDGYGK